ncbi:hypothetical protein N9U65_00805 [Planctomycetaceae bacterium]|nr:hypothetical protein [Planctomycetaceae bacterium]
MTPRASPYFGLTIASLLLFVLIGCRRPYPQLPAEQLKLIQGIRTAANTGNKQRVDAVKQAITTAIEAGEIPLETQELLRELLVDCENENYSKAERKCVLLLKDQLLQ